VRGRIRTRTEAAAEPAAARPRLIILSFCGNGCFDVFISRAAADERDARMKVHAVREKFKNDVDYIPRLFCNFPFRVM
jgi:hypothetical protein